MKHTTLIAVLCLPIVAFSQQSNPLRQVAQQSNGILIHESAGNEGFVRPADPSPAPVIRSVSDWSLPECEDALRFVAEKLAMLTDSEEDAAQRARYLAQRDLIEQRRNVLLNKP